MIHANAGAPMGRRYVEHIRSSLLGQEDGFIRCRCVLQAGIAFPRLKGRVSAIEALLANLGCATAEELRDILDVPGRRLIARPAPETFEPCDLEADPPEVVLRHALVLGLSTAQLFEPVRPVVWTEAALSRRIELFDPEGFYQ